MKSLSAVFLSFALLASSIQASAAARDPAPTPESTRALLQLLERHVVAVGYGKHLPKIQKRIVKIMDWGMKHSLLPTGFSITVTGEAMFYAGVLGALDIAVIQNTSEEEGLFSVSAWGVAGLEVGAGGSASVGISVNLIFGTTDPDSYGGYSVGVNGDVAHAVGLQGSVQVSVGPEDVDKLREVLAHPLRLARSPKQAYELLIEGRAFSVGVGVTALGESLDLAASVTESKELARVEVRKDLTVQASMELLKRFSRKVPGKRVASF
jgi:hypothetical protein